MKNYFIPRAENNYSPRILQTKRTIFYSAVFLLCKVIVVVFVIALPAEVFMSSDILSVESQKIAVLTNELRQQKNQNILKSNNKLNKSAAAKAGDMAVKEYFSHTSPSGETVTDFVRGSGYRYRVVGENLAIGFATAEEAMTAWKNSEAHYANLIDSDYIDLGVSLEIGNYRGESLIYMVQHFAAPLTAGAGTVPLAPTTASASTSVAAADAPTGTIAAGTEILSEKTTVSLASPDAVFGRPFWDSPLKKYLRAKEVSPAMEMFGVSQSIFLLAIIFFAVALCMSVFIEIKKQHPHIIAQTAGMIGLLVVLFLI
jgi:hypothetical protein